MCYAIPGVVHSFEGNHVIIDYYGQQKKAINELTDLAVGDYVYAQGGFVIQKVSPLEATETLNAWKDIFFELQDTDETLAKMPVHNSENPRLLKIIDRAQNKIQLKDEDYLYLAELSDEKDYNLLFKSANFIRQKYQQNSCCVHGIIEISNCCSRNCHYCGLTVDNDSLERYCMTRDEIVAAAEEAIFKYGFRALVLQSGENCGYSISELADIIKEIKQKFPVLIFVSFGEMIFDELQLLYNAGARGILLRFETSNPELYEKLHPGYNLATRIEVIENANKIGFLILTGGLIGLPDQQPIDIINDMRLAKKLNTEMYSFGPFIPHPDTPLAGKQIVNPIAILKAISMIRLLDQENGKILVTTGLETIAPGVRKDALLAGANSVMLNVTPLKYRELYSIYPNRAHVSESIEYQIDETINLLKDIGRAPTDLSVNQ